jgi:hypothetical protein
MGGEVLRRSDDRRAEVLGHADGHHVLLDELADLDARVKAGGYEVYTATNAARTPSSSRTVPESYSQRLFDLSG